MISGDSHVFQLFMHHLDRVVAAGHQEDGKVAPTVGYTKGEQYLRVVLSYPKGTVQPGLTGITTTNPSPYCFVRCQDGAIFRPSGWRQRGPTMVGNVSDYSDAVLGTYEIAAMKRPFARPRRYPSRPAATTSYVQPTIEPEEPPF